MAQDRLPSAIESSEAAGVTSEASVTRRKAPLPAKSNTLSQGASVDVDVPLVAQEEYCRQCHEQLTTAAHDLKTPVAILTGYVELLLSGKLGPLTDRQRGALQDMNDNGQRLNRFINNFLSLGSMKFSSIQLKLENADLNACLTEIVQVWAPSFQKKGVALFVLPGDGLPEFAFDYYKIQHVISNLLDNALKYSPSGSTVWVHADLHHWDRRVRNDGNWKGEDRRSRKSPQPNAVLVTVSDSGPGIAPEFHHEIFHEYFRIQGDAKTEGVGLGLAIAHRLVHLHKGTIWVESEPGMGAKFAFLLPLATVA